jgi:protein phosphatase
VVADGMGGAAAGEVASRLAVESVQRAWASDASSPPEVTLRQALEAANASILAQAERDTSMAGMGTTCTALVVIGRELWYAHVGDTRAYLCTRQGIRQLTTDHSLAAELGRQNGIEAIPARARNVLTRCLGVRPDVLVDASEEPTTLPDDATLVVCSDGLCNLVSDGEIHGLVSMHRPDAACRRLVHLARERGAPDNVSMAIASIVLE